MLQVLSITLPIFLLIGTGWVATRRGYTSQDNIRGIGVFVLRFALPALIFRALAQRDVGEILDGRYLLAYALGSLLPFASMFTVARRVRHYGAARSAMMALGSACSNSGFIGFGIAAMAVGHAPASVAMALTMIVENLVMIPLALGFAESEARADSPVHETLLFVLRRLRTNPMVLAILLGIAASLVGLHLPLPLARAIDLLANASTAAALFAVGGLLADLSVAGLDGDVVWIVASKLVLHPAGVAAFAWLVGGIAPELHRAMVILAAAPMLSILPLVATAYGQERCAAAALLGATVMSFVSLSAVLLML